MQHIKSILTTEWIFLASFDNFKEKVKIKIIFEVQKMFIIWSCATYDVFFAFYTYMVKISKRNTYVFEN